MDDASSVVSVNTLVDLTHGEDCVLPDDQMSSVSEPAACSSQQLDNVAGRLDCIIGLRQNSCNLHGIEMETICHNKQEVSY